MPVVKSSVKDNSYKIFFKNHINEIDALYGLSVKQFVRSFKQVNHVNDLKYCLFTFEFEYLDCFTTNIFNCV